ncbi:MAG: hypothetical protein AAF591_12810 [Verrucomicrobiota bacterium]
MTRPHSNSAQTLIPFAITIYRDRGAGAVQLGELIADYLNEVDPISPGQWTAWNEQSLHERLNPKHHTPQKPNHPISERSILSFIAHGAVILVDNSAHLATSDHPRTFNVRIAGSDSPHAATTRFHLTVNTRRMSQHTAVRVIADSALEWAIQPLQTIPPHPISDTSP